MARRFRASHSIRNFYIIVILFRVATVMSKRLNLQHFIRLLDAFNGIELENQEMTSNMISHVGRQMFFKYLNSLSMLIDSTK